MSRRISTFFGLFLIFSLIFSYTKFVFAATRTWDGGGATNNWSECANWSSDTCPTTADIATFDVTSTKDATIDASFTTGVTTLTISAGYTGTITQARSLEVSGSMSIASGTFSGAAETTTIGGTLTIGGGIYSASSGTTSVRSFQHTGAGTFAHNNGTVVATGSGSGSIFNVPTTEDFYDLQIGSTTLKSFDVSSGDTIVVNNTLTLNEGYISGGTVEAKGTIVVNAGWDGQSSLGALGTGILLIDGTNTQTLSIVGGANPLVNTITLNNTNFTFAGSGSGTMNFENVNLQSGTINATGFDLTIGSHKAANNSYAAANYSQTGGTLIGGTGTEIITGTYSLSGGTYTATSGTTYFRTDFSHSIGGTFSHNNGTVNFSGTNFTIAGSTTFYNFTDTSSAILNFPAGETQTILGTLTLTHDSGGRMQLRSTTPGIQAMIDPQGSRVLSDLDVMDNNNINDVTAYCSPGYLDSGNNINWSSGIILTESGGSTNITEGGATDTYTIVLESEPIADVTVTITVDSQVTTNVPSLTFTALNWNVPQTVTVTAVDDLVIEGLHNGIISHVTTSADPVFDGLDPDDVGAIITDNEGPDVLVSAISGDTTEAGGTATFTVVLQAEPTDDVVVPISSSDVTEGTVSASSLTFTSLNWSTPQTITVTGVDDVLVDGNIAYTIVVGVASSADFNYDGINAADVSVTNIDNDGSAGITVSTISGNTTEAGGTATFTIVLDALPSASVTIGLTSSDTTEGTVGVSSVIFTTENWSTPQTVTVTGVDDFVDDGDIAYSIVTAAATSADGSYSGMSVSDVSVTNIDNDTAGFTVSAISGNTTEAGGTATFTIVLTSQPMADVTTGLTSSDTTEGTIAVSSAIFTSENWSTPQTITVTGVNDDLDDGDIAYSIITAAATSADSGYSGINPANVSVTNADDDIAGITVGSISGDTTEAGATATFTVVLLSQPTADVAIGVSSSDTTEDTVSAASLTFTSVNWSTPQTITVTGVNDDLDDGDTVSSIVLAAATSADSGYNGINPSDVSVTNIDNEAAAITVSTISGNTTEAGGTATFTIVLASQPTADVTVGLTSSDTTEGTIAVSSAVFTSVNWSTPQTITVTGVNDDLDDGDIAYSIITAAATSVDSGYNAINPADVSVVNTDDDTAGFTVSAISGNTTEAGGTATFTIVLTSQPTADVTIGLTSSDTTEGTIAVSSVVFTSVNWSTPQTVTVTGINDADDDGDITYSIVIAAATSADSGYSGTNPADVSVINTDDDTTAESSDAGGGSAPMPRTGTITVTKVVVNDNGKTKGVDDFQLFMNDSVIVSGETYRVSAAPTLYTITETADSDYIGTFSGDCDAAGVLELSSGQNASCTITNDDIAESTPVTGAPSTPVSDPSSGASYPIPPVIDVEKTPSVTVLPDGPAPVTYIFTLRNIGTIPVADVSMVDDTCADVVFTSGDDNSDGILDIGEIWNYSCSTTLFTTSTGVVTATAWADGIQAVDTASSTLVVKENIFIPTFPNTGIASHSSPTSWMEFVSKTLGISLFCISVVFCLGTLRIVKNA